MVFQVRKLAYECAVKFSCKFPESWRKTEMAGKDWFTSFLKRNPALAIQKAQATSLARVKPKPMAKRKIFSSRYVVDEVLLSCEIFL